MLSLTVEDRKALCEKYPFLLPRNPYTKELPEDYDYTYINGEVDLPDGWFQLFLNMCEEILPLLEKENLLDSFEFLEIKEKYNTMRCYTSSVTREISDIINKYEYVSQFICQECGQPANICTTHGWIMSFCNDCAEDRKWLETSTTEPIVFNPNLTVYLYSKEGEKALTFDCQYIWDKLYS